MPTSRNRLSLNSPSSPHSEKRLMPASPLSQPSPSVKRHKPSSYVSSIEAIEDQLPKPNPLIEALKDNTVELSQVPTDPTQYKVSIKGLNTFTFVGVMQDNDMLVKKEVSPIPFPLILGLRLYRETTSQIHHHYRLRQFGHLSASCEGHFRKD
jgi:hypothetical protein